jgi:hypothetical protein
MLNKIKYSTTTPSGSLRKGNMAIGVDPSVTLGPTSVTGFYAGITPPSGGYTIYQNKVSQGPSIYVANNDSSLLDYVNDQVAGTIASPAGYTTVNQCLNYFATQSEKLCVNFDYEGIVTNGLLINVDAGFTPSYPRNGTSIYDLGGGAVNGTLTNGPTFNSGNGGSIVFDGVDDFVSITNPSILQSQNITLTIWINPLTPNQAITSIVDYDHATAPFQGWVLQSEDATTNRYYYFSYYDGSTFQPSTGIGAGKGIQINNSSWQNLTYTKNGTSIIGYLNGVQAFTSTASNANISYQSNRNLRIGGVISTSPGVGTRFYKGNISNTQIYNRALSATEILQNYNAQKSRFGL